MDSSVEGLSSKENSNESGTDDDFLDKNYVLSKNDLRDEKQDNAEDLESPPKKGKKKVNLHITHSICAQFIWNVTQYS